MVFLSDIVLDFSDTSGEVFIESLAHYWDLDAESMLPLLMYLRESNAAMTPHVILLDHSDEKKDSALLQLKTYCGKISSSMKFSVNHHHLVLGSAIDKCLTESYAKPAAGNITITGQADCMAYTYLVPAVCEPLNLKTDISGGVCTEVQLPTLCKLTELDHIYLYELDPLKLTEIDYFGLGSRLMSEVSIETSPQGDAMQASTVELNIQQGEM